MNREILFLPTCKGTEVIDTRTIMRIEALSNYSKLFFDNGKTLVVSKVLHWFEQSLSLNSFPESGGSQFLRIHRTHLVNRVFIQCYHSGKIKLLNGELIEVAKRRKNFFLSNWRVAA